MATGDGWAGGGLAGTRVKREEGDQWEETTPINRRPHASRLLRHSPPLDNGALIGLGCGPIGTRDWGRYLEVLYFRLGFF